MNIQYKRGHVKALDGIRGIAIILVLFFHCFRNNIFPFNYISELGWVGVDLFFVLSGFLITGTLIDSRKNKNFIKHFFIKRILRIFPLYYLTLILTFLLFSIPNISEYNHYLDKQHFESLFYYLTFTQNFKFAFTGWGITDILNHFWSLAIEEQFYLFWPFLILIFKKTQNLLLFCLFLIIIAIITRHFNFQDPFNYVFTLARMDSLVIGSMFAILIRINVNFLNRVTPILFILSIISLIVGIFLNQSLASSSPFLSRYGYTLIAFMFGSLIVFCFDQSKSGQSIKYFTEFSVFRFFGKYSYGIYVYHWIFYRGIYFYLEQTYSLSRIFILPFLLFVILFSIMSFHLF